MKLHSLKPKKGARDKDRYRVGRGMAQGRGKQAGKGQSGQNKRGGTRLGFEGGQNLWYRRLPKFGFTNFTHKEYQVVSLKMLNAKFKNGDKVDYEALYKAKIIKKNPQLIKILANGKLTKKLNIVIFAASKAAVAAIQKAGGTIKVATNLTTNQES